MTEPSISYLSGDSITRRIKEFPPVTNDEEFKDFQKLVAKMFNQIRTNYIGKQKTDIVAIELTNRYPWANFHYYNDYLLIDWNRDYLDRRGLCVDGYGKIQRKP